MRVQWVAAVFYMVSAIPQAQAQTLYVVIMQYAGDGELDTCATGKGVGLKDDGEGFLAVRSGPGGKYQKRDERVNGEQV